MAKRKKAGASNESVADYRFNEDKRLNIPPAALAAANAVPVIKKPRYAYSPHLPPVLRFDPAGSPDQLPQLLEKATRQKLTAEEAQTLNAALRNQMPWLEWAGKQEAANRGGFSVEPVALHLHERIAAQAILSVARRQDAQRSLFADPQQSYTEAVQFYQHPIDWANRLILGDSLEVMASLSRREDLAGRVQMIYLDPPYGIKFASNFQPEVGRRDVKDKDADLTREPEQIKAFRDTWHLGIHSYLSYLRDRLIVARELLSDTGSIFVQISDENIHRVRQVMDEVFGGENCFSTITFQKTTSASGNRLPIVADYLLWYAKDIKSIKYRPLQSERQREGSVNYDYVLLRGGESRRLTSEEATDWTKIPSGGHVYRRDNLTSQRPAQDGDVSSFELGGVSYTPRGGTFKTNIDGLTRLKLADRLEAYGVTLAYRRLADDYPFVPINNLWLDTLTGGFVEQRTYVVQTTARVIERCLLMTTDPGDLVLDPTCGSGTTAFVAEQWGRRWITIDTSRVAVALARQRLLTAKFDAYRVKWAVSTGAATEQTGVLGSNSRTQEANSREQAAQTHVGGSNGSGHLDPSHGFIYKTVPHITLGSIARNKGLDAIFARHQGALDAGLSACNAALGGVSDQVRLKLQKKRVVKEREEGKKAISEADRRRWELPAGGGVFEHWTVPFDTDGDWPKALVKAVAEYRRAWRGKMEEVNQAISAGAEQEELVDQPEKEKGVVRVSGPFTVEAVQPPEMSLGEEGEGAAHEVSGEQSGQFAGAPDSMDGQWSFAPVEAAVDPTRDPSSAAAYLDRMIELLRQTGVRFPNNKVQRFESLHATYDSRTGGGFHAEGMWKVGNNGDAKEQSVGVIFGPQHGSVTAAMIERFIKPARRRFEALVVAGFAFSAEAQAIAAEPDVADFPIHVANIAPDAAPGMEGLLKDRHTDQLFTVFGQPRIELAGPDADGMYRVTMEGVDIYDPVDNVVRPTGAQKVAAWFLDGDYDGRTFCVTQAFFPDKSAWDKLGRALKGTIDEAAFEALSGTVSLPFARGKHGRCAVKVIDPRGNEVMAVREM